MSIRNAAERVMEGAKGLRERVTVEGSRRWQEMD